MTAITFRVPCLPHLPVHSAQSAVQTKLTALVEAYKAECDSMQGGTK